MVNAVLTAAVLVLIAAAVLLGVFLVIRSRNQRWEIINVQPAIRESNELLDAFASSGETEFTVLVENNRSPDLRNIEPQHGISILIERKGSRFLLDLGNGDLYSRNATSLGKETADVDFTFISHGHYDHGGGLKHFLKTTENAPVYLSEKAISETHIAKIMGLVKKDISLNRNLLEEFPDRFRFIDAFTEIEEDIFIIPSISVTGPLPVANGNLFKMSGSKVIPDDFDHEQVLVIRDSDGLIVFSGCCHNGISNVLDTVKKYFPETGVKAVIGGFHLFSPSKAKMAEKPEDIRKLGNSMLQSDTKMFITGHCTGVEAYTILKSTMGNRLAYFSAGCSFSL